MGIPRVVGITTDRNISGLNASTCEKDMIGFGLLILLNSRVDGHSKEMYDNVL